MSKLTISVSPVKLVSTSGRVANSPTTSIKGPKGQITIGDTWEIAYTEEGEIFKSVGIVVAIYGKDIRIMCVIDGKFQNQVVLNPKEFVKLVHKSKLFA